MPIEDFIINVYVYVDDFFQSIGKIRKSSAEPQLTDAEVVTMEIVGEFLGYGYDKTIYDYFRMHWKDWFPRIGSRTSFARQSANLWKIKQMLYNDLLKKMGISKDSKNMFLFDGVPIPMCHVKRVGSHHHFKGQANFGYCATKDHHYYGFKGHVITTPQGVIVDYEIAAANIDERDILPELIHGYQGDLIADKGLIRPMLTEELANRGISLHHPLKSNMKDDRPKAFIAKLMNIRRNIETVFSQLTERFNFQSIRAKDLWHLTTKIGRKILAHTFGCFIAGSLQFDQILRTAK